MSDYQIGEEVYIFHPVTRKKMIGTIVLPLENQPKDSIHVAFGKEIPSGYGPIQPTAIFRMVDVIRKRG